MLKFWSILFLASGIRCQLLYHPVIYYYPTYPFVPRQVKSQHDFEICPESHPAAFRRGRKCCKPEFYQDPAWSSDTCDGDAIYCKDFSCESYGAQNCNYISIQNSGFSDYDGSYVITEFLEANRPVFQKDDSCVWDQQYKTFFANTDGTMFISSHLMNLTN